MKGFLAVLLLVPLSFGFRRVDRVNHTGTASKACLNLMVIGDFGSRSSIQYSVASGLAKVAQQVNAQAVLAMGDIIYDSGAKSESDMINHWMNVYPKKYKSLRKKWYAITGNHDWYSDANVERRFTSSGKNSGKLFQMPNFWHKVSFPGSVDVFFIDTEIWRGSVPSMKGKINEQINWLSKSLQGSRARVKIVCGHHPLYSSGWHGNNDVPQLESLLKKNGVKIYIAAHNHLQEFIQVGGINHVVSGAGGKNARAACDPSLGESCPPRGSLKKAMRTPGFASLAICGTSVSIKYYNAGGGVLYSTSARSRSVQRGADAQDSSVRVSAPNKTCRGRTLQNVNGQCADGCTVLPAKQTTCSAYCEENALSCDQAWQNEYEDCGKGQAVPCDSLVTQASMDLVCHCS